MKKQIEWTVAVLMLGAMLFAPSVMAAKKDSGSRTPKIPKPDTVESVDAAGFSFKVATGQHDRRLIPYTVTAFTKILVNDKTAKLEEIQKGMRVSVVSTDGKTASRVEAHEFASGDDDKKDAKKDPPKNAKKKK
jgi:hypothetical protein